MGARRRGYSCNHEFNNYLTVGMIKSSIAGGLMSAHLLLSAIVPIVFSAFAVTFLVVWQHVRKGSHIRDWALVYLLAAGAFIIQLLQLRISPETEAFAANALLALAGVFTARGMATRYGSRIGKHWLWSIFAATMLGVAVASFVIPSIIARSFAINVGIGAMLMFGATAIVTRGKPTAIDSAIAIHALVTSLLLFARPVSTIALEIPMNSSIVDPSSFYIVTLKLLALTGWLGFAILFLVRVAVDIIVELRDQALSDPLTGLLNRRGFFENAQAELAGRPAGIQCSVLLIDIDHFKQINDRFGHGVGDEVIRAVGTILSRLPFHPIAARIGGEEFAILLPTTPLRAAKLFGEGIRTGIAAWHDGQMPYGLRITGSVGVAEFTAGGDVADALRRADIALYAAKRSGRDKVCCEDDVLAVQGTKRA